MLIRIIIVSYLLAFISVQGEEQKECNAKNAEDLLYCAMKSNPKLKLLALGQSQQKSLEKIAKQIPNLEIDSRLLYGTGDSSLESEISIMHTFEIGGRRSARVSRAQKNIEVYSLKKRLTQQEVLTSFWMKLNRVRQIKHELELLKEASRTYRQIRKRYRRFPRLSPEQKLGSDVFLFAAEENEEHIKELNVKSLLLLQKLVVSTGLSEKRIEKLLPEALDVWPIVASAKINNSPFVLIEQAKLSLSKAELEFQESQAWPNLKIGPSADLTSTGSNNFGVSFAIQAPLYHQNQGEKEFARRGIVLAKSRMNLVKANLKKERQSLITVYRNSTKNLNTKKRLKTIESKHKRLHSLIRRGVVHTSLVIELHRQQFDLISKSHENELQAIESLWGVYSIDGTIFKEAAK